MKQAEPIAFESGPEVTDAEIIEFAETLVTQQKPRPEIKTALLNEFSGIEADVDSLIDRAFEKAFEAQESEIEEIRKVAFEATDKRVEAEAEADKHLVEKYQIAGRLGKSIDPNDTKRAAKIIRLHEEEEEKHAEQEEKFDDTTEEPFPECPVFTGPLTDLATTLYPSLPLEFKQIGMIVRWGLLRSGIDKLQWEPHLQPRFDVIMVSLPNRGKTAANNETRKAMDEIAKLAKADIAGKNKIRPTARVFGDFTTLASADSGPFLVGKFYELVKEAEKQVAVG